MTSLFVPLLFVCWSNGECTAFFDPVETDITEYEGEVRPLAEITINSF